MTPDEAGALLLARTMERTGLTSTGFASGSTICLAGQVTARVTPRYPSGGGDGDLGTEAVGLHRVDQAAAMAGVPVLQ